jgi:preprotein translocase subunit SecB
MTDNSSIEEVAENRGFSGAEYNAVALTAKLRAINLLNSNFDFNPEPGVDQDQWKLAYGVRVTSCKYQENGEFAAAVIRYTMTAKYMRKKIIACTAELGVFYDVGVVKNPDAAEAFCNNVGVFAAYPYFRALVSNLLWNAGVNLPPLPAIASTAHIPKSEGN